MDERLKIGKEAYYRIKVQGTVSESWSDYLGGLEIDVKDEKSGPVTTLFGLLQDQAALLGVLNSLYELGFPLLDVECQYSPKKEK